MQEKTTRKDSVTVNKDKLNELMKGMSLRAYSHFLSTSDCSVPYKTLQRMKNGQAVNEINIHAIAKAHGITFKDLLETKNTSETKEVCFLKKISSVNELYSQPNFSFFRLQGSDSPGTVISNKHYMCTIDKETSALIKDFLEKTMGENTNSFYLSGKNLNEEFAYLDSIADGNEILKKLEDRGIYLFYGEFRRRQIANVNTPVLKINLEEENRSEDESDIKKEKTTVPCLIPFTIYNEVFMFREIPFEYDKIKIFPDEGYSFDELKKDYLKVLKQQLSLFEKEEKEIDKILKQTEEWLDYQEKEKSWIFNLPDFDNPSLDFNFHNALPLTHTIRFDEGILNKFKFHYRNIKTNYLLGAKAILDEELNAEKEKEDDHVDTSS